MVTGEKKRWFLKKGWVYALCFITPPIGYLFVFLHRKEWEHEEMIKYLGVATITMSYWILKFFPFGMSMTFFAVALLGLYAHDLLKK